MSLIDKQFVFEYPQDINTVYGKILSVSSAIEGLYPDYTDNARYTLYLKSGVTFWSWGENVSIQCVPVTNNLTRVIIISKPKIPTTLVDFGKGKKNINNVLAALRRVLV